MACAREGNRLVAGEKKEWSSAELVGEYVHARALALAENLYAIAAEVGNAESVGGFSEVWEGSKNGAKGRTKTAQSPQTPLTNSAEDAKENEISEVPSDVHRACDFARPQGLVTN